MMERKLPSTATQMLDQTPYEHFLNRVVPVLGQDTVQTMNSQQATVLQETLADLWEEIQSYEGISNEMIKGAWDVTEHLHPSDGSLRY